MRKVKAKAWPANQPYDRAMELMDSNDPRSALALFAAAAKLQPDRARIHANHAWALSRLGRHAKAKSAAKKAYALDARDTYVVMRLVDALFEAHDDEVVEPARKALRMPAMNREDLHHAHLALCWTLMRTAPGEAVRETERLLAEWPDDHEALAARGCALGAVCRFEEGLASVDLAIAAAPDATWLSARRDALVQGRDMVTSALRQLTKAAELHREDADGWRRLALGLARFARLSEALIVFERARELDSRDSDDELRASALMVEATARTQVLMDDITPIG